MPTLMPTTQTQQARLQAWYGSDPDRAGADYWALKWLEIRHLGADYPGICNGPLVTSGAQLAEWQTGETAAYQAWLDGMASDTLETEKRLASLRLAHIPLEPFEDGADMQPFFLASPGDGEPTGQRIYHDPY